MVGRNEGIFEIHNTIVIFSVSPIVQEGWGGVRGGVKMCLRKKSILLVLTVVRKKMGFFPSLEISCASAYTGKCGTAQLKLSRAIFLTDLSVLLLTKKKKLRKIEELELQSPLMQHYG